MARADAQYKLRLYDPDSRSSAAVFLGPTFGGPVNRLVAFRSATTSGESFLAYSTSDRVS